MKQGYSTDEPQEKREGCYSFTFIPLVREASKDSTLVGYIIKVHSSISGSKKWYGIPFGNNDLLNRCFGAIEYPGLPMIHAFFKVYATFETMEEKV
ncbi:MAG: hypothetical protein ABI763_05755 [Bacteroidota bacterium]